MNEVDRIIDALKAAGHKGLRHEELVTRLNLDPKEMTTLIEDLITEGKIMQKQELENTRYLIRGVTMDSSDTSGVSDLNGCPCFHCLKISRCGIRQPDSPLNCGQLDTWMIQSEPA